MSTKSYVECKEYILNNLDKVRVGIAMHATPDPDCIASAVAIDKILRIWNPEIKSTYLYSGEISHAQNKTLVNMFAVPMTLISEIDDLKDQFDLFVVVDTTPERALPEDIECFWTIDHHRSDTKKTMFKDIRSVGACSSIIWDYFRKENIEFVEGDEADSAIATLLLIGIKTDTGDLLNEDVTELDHQAHKNLIEYANKKKIQAIMKYPIPSYYFEVRSKLDQIENIRVDNGVFVGGVGYLTATKRDALPMMADERSRVEDIHTAFVFGVVGDHIEVSVRSGSVSVDVNGLCQKIFGKQYAGGKMGAGAAKVPLGFMALSPNSSEASKSKIWDAIKETLIDKIFHVVSGNE